MPAPSPLTGRLAVLGLCLCALPAGAQARRVAVVGIAIDGATQAEAASAARAVTAFVAADSRFEAVSPAIQARDDGPAREAKGLEARRLFLEGRDQLDNLATAKALATLEKSIKFHEASDLSQGVQGLLDALALRAIAALSKGDKAGFTTDAQRALSINPDHPFDPSRLTPAAQAALEPLRKKAKAAPPAALELSSSPPNAWAFVDGVFRGVTPITVPGLAPGSHVVTLVATGFELVQEKVFAGAGPTPAFTLKSSTRGKDVLARIGELRAALERGEPGAAAGALATFIQAEELLIVAVSTNKGEAKALAWRVLADGTVVGDARAPLSSPSASSQWQQLAKELLALAAPAPKKREPALVLEGAQADGHAGRRPFGWVGLALTAGAAGAGAGVGLLAKSTAQSANRTAQVDTATYERLASSARTQAAVADGLFISTAVLGAASIFLLATGYAGGADSADDEDAGLLLSPTAGGALVGLGGSF